MTTATQIEAYEHIKPHVGRLQGLVLDYIQTNGGATDEEVRTALNLRYGSGCARRKELQDRGLVRNSGKTRLTTVGRNAIVWEAT